MKFIFKYIFISTFLIEAGVPDSIRIDETPEMMISMIESKGCQKILYETYNNQKLWNSLSNKIENCDSNWLKVARHFYRCSDAATTEELGVSLGKAITVSPFLVFKYMGFKKDQKINAFAYDSSLLRWSCASLEFDEEPGHYKRGKSKFIKRIKSLKNMNDTIYAWEKRICKNEIENNLEQMKINNQK